jgi:chorismate mutase
LNDENPSGQKTIEDKGDPSPSYLKLEELRLQIDEADQTISALIDRRVELVRQVAQCKDSHNLPTLDANREAQVIDSVCANGNSPEAKELIKSVYLLLMKVSKEQQEYLRQR